VGQERVSQAAKVTSLAALWDMRLQDSGDSPSVCWGALDVGGGS
jgi:hypothetical protein